MIDSQVKTKGVRKISFEQFLTALAKLADRKVWVVSGRDGGTQPHVTWRCRLLS